MKNLMLCSVLLLLAAPAAVAQDKVSPAPTVESTIIALEQEGWKAWKNRDAAWFQANTTDSFLSISSEGISDKAQVVKATPTECEVKAFSLANFQFVMLDQNAVLLTYTATQDAVCNGKKAPAAVRAAVNYVKRGDRWLEAMYMQTP
ncbi:MAG: nuclear transport factor 2 family protein [Acidobacteriota bacterium]